MQTFTVTIEGVELTLHRDTDGKFIIPDGWRGTGTALKPAFEPIILARKPLSESTIAANVLRWRTGALNIDGCRVGNGDDRTPGGNPSRANFEPGWGMASTERATGGRWPANVVTDGSEVVCDMFPESSSGVLLPSHDAKASENLAMSGGNYAGRIKREFGGDSGSASRFFYSSKANADDRAGSKHPTVKPVSLKQWLVRLITPPGGITADPFAGTGTTGEAAVREGMRCIMVEREATYQEDIRHRMGMVFAGPEERQRRNTKPAPASGLPLFKAAENAPAPHPDAPSLTVAQPRPVPKPAPPPAAPGPDAVSLLAKLRAGAGRLGGIPKLTTEAIDDGHGT